MPDPVVTTTPVNGATPPADFDSWLAAADEPTKAIVNARFAALDNTVKATRTERDDFKKQIKDLQPLAAKGSELEASLTELSTRIELADRRANFAEEALKPEVGCSNSRAAFLVATADNLFDRKGAPLWDKIKAAAPELFKVPVANAAPGAGTGLQPAGTNSHSAMNDFIRNRGRG